MTGPAHAHRKPMGALPAPHGSSQPGPDLDVRADGPSRVAPETPPATMRRAVQRLRAIGMVTDALEGTGRIHLQDRFIAAVYAAVAAVLDQAADRWDDEMYSTEECDGPFPDGEPALKHSTDDHCGGLWEDDCECFTHLHSLALAVLGEVRP